MNRYIVSIKSDGSFKAVGVGPNVENFSCDFWHVFQTELYHRLLDEKTPTLRQVASRKGSDKTADGFLGPDNKGNKNE